MQDFTHLLRVLVLLVLAVAVGAIARSAMVPDSFGKYGPYRADHLTEEMSASPVYGSDDDCLECHEKEWDMADGRHANVPCVDCHFISVPHAEGKRREIENLMEEYARNASQLAFETLYTVMSKGWDKEKIKEIIDKLNTNALNMTVKVFRGDPVIKEFGDVEEERAAREEDPNIMAALRDGKDSLLWEKGNKVRYIYAIKAKAECLECHTQAKEGEVNGVIDVTFPFNLVVPRDTTKLKQITDVALKDARHASRLVFKSLYTVMRRGWDKEKINELVLKLNKNNLSMAIRLFRGPMVVSQFGDIEGEREIRESDPNILRALRLGNDILITDNPNQIRYLYPIKAAKECLNCHSAAGDGDALGIVEINFPLNQLKIQGLRKLADMPIDRSKRSCQMCHSYSPARPIKFPQVKDFSKHYINNWKKEMGAVDKGASCLGCHKAHMPRIVKKGS